MREISLIGKGGFGNVFEVEDASGTRFAKKVFSINQVGDFPPELAENVKRRFVREANTQAAINHQNIMPVVQKDLDANPPSFVMPLAKASLFSDIQQDKALGGYALQAIMDILSGLEELHSMHITHRDLKPQNVLRLPNPDGSHRYAISDFGLMSIKDTQLSVLTQTGMRMGSDYYTAPEIVADLRQASARSDIYSVGCIMHDLFGSGSRIPCNEISDSGFYADILAICTRREPGRRFGSVGDLREAILSLGTAGTATVVPKQVADYIDLLSKDEELERDIWEKIIGIVERDASSTDAIALLKNLSQTKISEIVANFPDLARRLCGSYANWVQKTAFDFGLCDGIANRVQAFFDLDDYGCKAEVLLALLLMGTSHNRWYVERKFFNHCGPEMNQNLAKRLTVEIRVMKWQVCTAVAHMERSIGVSRANLHPLVLSTLEQVC